LGFIYNYPGAQDQATYDLENAIADPTRRIEQFIQSRIALDGIALADIGAGGGYHACLYAAQAAHVFAVEPAPAMVRQLYERMAAQGVTNLSVLVADAEAIPLRDQLVDVVHSRFAYFFGPERPGEVRSCAPGIAEALRILKTGGYFFIIDNAHTSGQFAAFLEQYAYTRGRARAFQDANDAFYAGHSFQHTTIESTWTAPDRTTLRQVVAMEFPPAAVEPIMAQVTGASLSYHYRVYYRQK